MNDLLIVSDAVYGNGVLTSITSGTLVVGVRYVITTYNASDDFTNVGAASNATGVEFVATGASPTDWDAASVLDKVATEGGAAAADLATGALGFVADNGLFITPNVTASELKDVKSVQAVLGDATTPIWSEPFERDGKIIVDVDFDSYVAPVKNVIAWGAEKNSSAATYAGLAFKSSIAVGDNATFTITRQLQGVESVDEKVQDFYSIYVSSALVKATDLLTVDAILAALIAKINARVDAFCSVAAVSDGSNTIGLLFTADNYGDTLEVSTSGVFEGTVMLNEFAAGVDTSIVKGMYPGVGTYEQIVELERIANGEKGYSDKLQPDQYKVWQEASRAVSTITYDGVTLAKSDVPPGGIGESVKMTANKPNAKIVFSSASGFNAFRTDLDAILAAIWGAGRFASTTVGEPADDVVS